MLTLAIDTADSRGSVALLRDEAPIATVAHDSAEDYSSWLLPAASQLAARAGVRLPDVELYAVVGGPGSFTGLRVGLTTVKAWSEIHSRPIAAVSRLEAIASTVAGGEPWIATFFDAHRKQLFGGLYRREAKCLTLVGEEMVIAPAGYLGWVQEQTQGAAVAWASLDPEVITRDPAWTGFAAQGHSVAQVSPMLAAVVGKLGLRMARQNSLTDALRLDANYVRRSDAELFWKGSAAPDSRSAHGTRRR